MTERLRGLKDRFTRRGSHRRAARLERAQKKARAEALRREYQREDMDSKIHRQ
jgi:hypothetical protein